MAFFSKAAGATVSDEAMKVVNEMSASSQEDIKKRKKAVLFCLSPDKKRIVLDEGKEILVGDCCDLDDVYGHFIKMLPKDYCLYALYNATYETKEAKKEALVFTF